MTSPNHRLAAALSDRYTIERVLGSGGMATVYLALDIRHSRRVALKVMRPELAGAIGVERFLLEIRTTAGLQHPHIVPLHDSGEVDGTAYFVMAYIEGESLRDRLAREGPLPVADSVRIARDVADALDYAHRHGIAHRDIKPENILLHDQRAFVTDFGIALALGRSANDARLTASGLSVGTPQYMSPEQAMGERAITPRADIFALGAVLYEMLAGEPPFTGPSAQAIVARTLTQEPAPIRDVRGSVPEHVAHAIARALAKLPADRFSTAAEFATALAGDDVAARPAFDGPPARASASTVRRYGRVALMLAAGTVIAFVAWTLARRTEPQALTRLTLPLEAGELVQPGFAPIDVSRDGRHLVFVVETNGRSSLSVRALADTMAHPLAGTEGGRDPFFSHDGEWIGFFQGDRLMKVPRRGGAPSIVVTVPANSSRGGSWGDDDTIIFSAEDRIYRVSPERGTAEAVEVTVAGADGGATTDLRSYAPRDPSLLPGAASALVTTDDGVMLVDLRRGTARRVLRGSHARYLPSGHLLFDDNEGRIRVVSFDLHTAKTAGASVPVIEAFRSPGGGMANFAVSDEGTVVYLPGSFRRSLVRVTREGAERPITNEPRGYRFPAVSPDGRTIAVTVDPRPSSIWLVDATRGTASRLTAVPQHSIGARWAVDGARLVYSDSGLRVVSTDGGSSTVFYRSTGSHRSISAKAWLRDGRLLAVEGLGGWQGGRRIVMLTAGDSAVRIVSPPTVNEDMPLVTPDERWVAFASDVSGIMEIYVRPLFGTGPTVGISTGGGVEPRWSRRGDELFFRKGTTIMSARVRTHPDFAILGPPTPLLSGTFDFSQTSNWDVLADGAFVFVRSDPPTGSQFRVMLNFDAAEAVRAVGRAP